MVMGIKMWARIESDIVRELTDVDPIGRFHESLVWVKCSNKVEQGWVYRDGKFSAPIVDETIIVPSKVTRRQGRLALLEMGWLDRVESTIGEIEDDTNRRSAEIEYEADTWERGNDFLENLWSSIGGEEEQLDELFILAATK